MSSVDRRNFLKTTLGGCLGLAAGVPFSRAAVGPGGDERPNIIVILADDMGFSDLGCYGSEIRTPNLDRMGAEGVRFRWMYNCARCCPTRASLLTGLYPPQNGIGYMWKDFGAPGYQGYLNENCVTIAEVLREAGYATWMSGKWHVGRDAEHWPRQRGFEKFYGLIGGAARYWGTKGGLWVDGDQRFRPGKSFYATDAFTDRAVQFLDEHDGQRPFFLYLAYTAPHWPLHAWQEDIRRYRERYREGWHVLRRERWRRMIDMGIVRERWGLPAPRPDTTPWSASDPRSWEEIGDQEEWALRMAVYAAMIDRMDQGIGRVMRKLREMGAEQNTLVLFLSDNGAGSERREKSEPGVKTGQPGSFVAYGPDWAAAGNTPLRRYKRWVDEGGIATPLIAYWPTVIPDGGTWSDEVSHVIDIMATCIDAAGADYPERYEGRDITPLEGRSLLPVLRGNRRAGHKILGWSHEGHYALRKGRWKLVFDEREHAELFDLVADRTETTDLSARYPEKVAELLKQFDAWADRVGVVPFHELPRVKNP